MLRAKKSFENYNRNDRGEKQATLISEMVFFIEYYLYSQLVSKMKLFGKNALFSLRRTINVANNVITGLATATAICLRALPLPRPLKINPSR